MKICTKCGKTKPLSEYYIHKHRGKMVPYPRCKVCRRAESTHRYHNQPGVKEANKIRHRERRYELRGQVFELLGNKCSKCDNSDERVLQIDHVNAGGRRERRSLGIYSFLLKIITERNTNDYQLLCANCNWIKRIEEGAIGHEI